MGQDGERRKTYSAAVINLPNLYAKSSIIYIYPIFEDT